MNVIMKKKLHIILKGILFSLIPTLFTLLGSNDILYDLQKNRYIGTSIDVKCLKDCLSTTGAILTFLFITFNISSHETKEKEYKDQSTQLLKNNKEILLKTLSQCLGIDYVSFNIRIFLPHKNIYWKLLHHFNPETPLFYHIKNVNGLADVGTTNNLKFCVDPPAKQEGLIGECYKEKKIVYDNNLKETNGTKYNLSQFQISKTNDLKFCLACPIFKEKEIVAIITFDSKQEIKITQDIASSLPDIILNYSQLLYENVPQIFKKKGD